MPPFDLARVVADFLRVFLASRLELGAVLRLAWTTEVFLARVLATAVLLLSADLVATGLLPFSLERVWVADCADSGMASAAASARQAVVCRIFRMRFEQRTMTPLQQQVLCWSGV
ncbi:MAG: hypothetical protein A2W72_20360 [Burkholderiales bacterium RIFCSPLOWO2_12_67_14]|nr:MAG: hypothetical protein A3I64_01065 [Burkholderiales bacterium RIFCSPLOWO2_02_FULL_67_64]OGB43224.1 MAG: hypothetical protein A2W72_20360 [Burkholderiales bacterium RIFCSPLOWO2_12_67_14]OGB51545.1 MAG: hypothetical protein A3E51_26560 [Burkholderiales bacterium RIFCSPHIGHO2_12_FULL_67_38]OGB94272.1 MAG: hypothetical protein A3G82_07185 [Burkholderiales bacterium RIFCSPLOWO2_12_FULL_67_210]